VSEPPPTPLGFPVQTTVLHPEPGSSVVVDYISGRSPAYTYLHGFGSVRDGIKSSALFRHARQQGNAAARFDFRGHGESSGQPNTVTISELIADTTAVLELTGPAILVGTSLGGLVAAFTAAAHSRTIQGLTMLAPALGFVPQLERHLDDDGYLPTSDRPARPVHPRVIDDAGNLDESSLPGRLTMPVFVAHGLQDDVVPAALSRDFFAAIPHDRKDLWLIEDGDHRLSDPIDQILDRMERLFAQLQG